MPHRVAATQLENPPTSWQVRQGEALALLQNLPTGSVDAVITDPPYSSGGNARDRERPPTTKYVSTGARVVGPDFPGDNRDQRSWAYWCVLWLTEALRAARPGAVIAVTSDWRQVATMTDTVQAGGWIFRGIVPWVKPIQRARPRRGLPRNQAEYVVWGTNGPHHPQADAPYLPGVVEADPPHHTRRQHITEKPVELLDPLVQMAPPGGLVVDPFTGAGTTGVAAVRQGRRFIGFEAVAHYAAIAQRRVAAACEPA